ncbi:MAG TPA: hypothetical protein VFO18_10355 [Methylomirabilota bacterium]|nr:hypothetical protein [Methylomirabilota bacterium]
MAERVMIIVPRTAPALYAYLKEKFAGDPTVSVIVDRRTRERRQKAATPAAERRRAERRNASRPSAVVVTEG